MSRTSSALLVSALVLGSAVAASAAYSVETFAQANLGGYPYLRQDNSTPNAFAQQGSQSYGWSSVVDGRLKAFTSANMYSDGVMASASAWVRLQDVLRIGGTSGNAVQFRITYNVHGTMGCDRATYRNDDAWGQASIQALTSRGMFENGYTSFYQEFDFRPNHPELNPQSASTIISTYEGQTLSINLFLNSQVFSGINDNFNLPAVSAISDFGNTSVFTVEPITPGASFSADSGFTYAVPEPSLGGVVIGLGFLFARRKHAAE